MVGGNKVKTSAHAPEALTWIWKLDARSERCDPTASAVMRASQFPIPNISSRLGLPATKVKRDSLTSAHAYTNER